MLCLISLFSNKVQAQGNKPQTKQLSQSTIIDKWCITENKGQLEPEIKYNAELPGAHISFQQNNIRFSIKSQDKNQELNHDFAMQLVGANLDAQILGEEKIAGKLIFNAVSENVNISTNQYKALLYKDIYAGIDLRFKVEENKGIKYEFIVHPGADVNAIKIKWTGTDKISPDGNGGLNYFNENISISDDKPISFSEGKPIESKFITNEGITTFSVGDYNHEQDLIIDPVIQWSTYYGSYATDERITKVLPDNFGNVYVLLEYANEYDSRLVTPAFDSIKWQQGSHVVIAKFDSSGARIWGTYLPDGLDMAIDDSGNVYYLTWQNIYRDNWNRYVSKNAYQTTLGGNENTMNIIKLDSAGEYKWGTLYGGTYFDHPNTLYAKNGYVYVTGQTNNTFGVATFGSPRSLPDVLLVKFRSDGQRVFGTYLSGSEGKEFVLDITVDEEENIYICGATTAKTNFTTFKAHQTKPFSTNSDDWDGYIAKFDKNGIKKWVTYYASTANLDYVRSICVDKNGSVFVLSTSHGNFNYPVYPAYSSISRFDSLGKRIWEKKLDTFIALGQTQANWIEKPEWWKLQGNKMQLDGNGILSVAGIIGGSVYGGKIKVTDNAIRKNNVDVDGFLQLYNSEGKKLYSSYFGGKYIDKALSAAGDNWGGHYIAGSTYGNDLHTKDAYDTTSQYDYGYEDGFLARLKFDLPVEAGLVNVKAGTIKAVCENTNSELKLWIKNNGWKKIDSLKFNWKIDDTLQKPMNWTGFVPAGDSIIYNFKAPLIKAGTHAVKIWISNGDAKNDTVTLSFTVNAIPPVTGGTNKRICTGEKTKLGSSALNGLHYQWSTATNILDTLSQILVSPLQTTTYYVIVTNVKTGCAATDSVTVTVNALPEKRAGSDKIICAGETVQLGDSIRNNYTYSWSTVSGFVDSVAQPIVQPMQTTSYFLTVTDTTGCFMQDTVEVKVNAMPVAKSIFGEKYICKNGASWYKYKKDANETILWQTNGVNFIGKADADSILVKWDSTGKYTIKLNIKSASQCTDSTSINVEVYPRTKPSFTVSANSVCINETITLKNTTAAATSIKWIFPDGSTDTSQAITKAFSGPGIYAIWLKAATVNGCTDSVKQEITVYDLPGKDWKISSSKPGVFSFKALDSLQFFYRWYFGTGDSASNANANYIYTNDGKYLVSLKIRNSNGCEIQKDTTLDVTGIVSVRESNRDLISLNAYPNPFKDQTIIEYNLDKASHVSISLIDVNGRIQMLTQQQKQLPGTNQFVIDAGKLKLSAGIYLVKIEADGIPAYKKIVKLK